MRIRDKDRAATADVTRSRDNGGPRRARRVTSGPAAVTAVPLARLTTVVTYKLYIGGASAADGARARLLRLLRSRPDFRFEDLGLPPGAPSAEVRRRMRAADAVLLLLETDEAAAPELALARALGRPIIGVAPAGERAAPAAARRVADEVVGLDPELVVDAIRQYALPA